MASLAHPEKRTAGPTPAKREMLSEAPQILMMCRPAIPHKELKSSINSLELTRVWEELAEGVVRMAVDEEMEEETSRVVKKSRLL